MCHHTPPSTCGAWPAAVATAPALVGGRRLTLLLALSLLVGPAQADRFIAIPAGDFPAERSADAPLIPTAVALGDNGDVLLLDGAANRILCFNSAGQQTAVIKPERAAALRQPVGLRRDREGRLWLADSGHHRLVVLAPTGEFIEAITLPAGPDGRPCDPTDLAVLPGGGLLVIDNENHRVLRRGAADASWESLGRTGTALGQFQYPFQLAVAPNGDWFISDVINARVQLWNARGEALRVFGAFGVERGQFYRPGGVALDAADRLWIADSVTGAIQVFRGDGALLDVVRDRTDAPLRCKAPLGLAFDAAGALYVVESRAGRVRKFLIEHDAQSGPVPTRGMPSATGSGRQAKNCTICHIDWLAPFADGRNSELMARPLATGGEPVVAREELCLSCHDGTVADSRLRVWREHGHATGVTPKPETSIPDYLPLAENKLACRTCHSAHGQGAPDGDFRRAILLRVENPNSELCIACHGAHGPSGSGLATGLATHPSSGRTAELRDVWRHAGARQPQDAGAITCEICHTPHGSGHEHLLVFSPESNLLCTDCHAGHANPNPFGWSDRPHPVDARLDADQMAAVRRADGIVGSDGTLACLSCHRMHQAHGDRALLIADPVHSDLCIDCHQSASWLSASPHDLRTPARHPDEARSRALRDHGLCGRCHAIHGPGTADDIFEVNLLDPSRQCITCHSETGGASHGVLFGPQHPVLYCNECHNPHEPRFGHYLRERPEQLCRSCHADYFQLSGSAHDAAGGDPRWCDAGEHTGDRCLSCHRPHGGEVGPFRAQTAGPNHAGATCSACHSAEGGATPPRVATHPPVPMFALALSSADPAALPLYDDAGREALDGQIECRTCHLVHTRTVPSGIAAHQAHSLLRPFIAPNLCTNCHGADGLRRFLYFHDPDRRAAPRP